MPMVQGSMRLLQLFARSAPALACHALPLKIPAGALQAVPDMSYSIAIVGVWVGGGHQGRSFYKRKAESS